jgi:phosphoglycerate dehydrogenase-like enzyme
MNKPLRITVTSRSFSKNSILVAELKEKYPTAKITLNGEDSVLEGDRLIQFLSDCDRAITGLEKIDETILKHLPELKHISKYGVGLDMIDFPSLKNAGVTLGWTGGVNRRSVAELTLYFMLGLMRGADQSHENLLKNQWTRAKGFHLSEKTIGIVGCGNVGKDLVRLLSPFGCRILVSDPKNHQSDYQEFYRSFSITPSTLEETLKLADIVTLHVPKSKSTLGLISAEKLKLMKSNAFLINTARGGIVDESALLSALSNQKLAGAAMDVFNIEPPTAGTSAYDLIHHPKFYGTPHIGGGAEEAMLLMGRAAIQNLENFEDPIRYSEEA